MEESLLALYKRLDTGIEAWNNGYRLLGGELFCTKGCCNCCTLAVNCTFPEAQLLAGSIPDTTAVTLSGHVDRLKAAVSRTTDLRSFLDLHRKELGPCPFLEPNGSCGAYQARPCACRSLISTKESRWCAQDFSILDSSQKQDFMNSLDRSVVAFPMHYSAAAQEMALEAEAELVEEMHEQFGYSLYGNLPVLVHMELKYRLSRRLSEGRRTIETLLAREGVHHPFLTLLSDKGPD